MFAPAGSGSTRSTSARHRASALTSSVSPNPQGDGFVAFYNEPPCHLLVIDEAKEILGYRHGALSNLIRKSAEKGGVVMLLSQSPEDFDQEADDYLSQMGTIAVFASSAQSLKNLRAALGRRVSPEDFSDKELPKGVAMVKLYGRDPLRIIAWT